MSSLKEEVARQQGEIETLKESLSEIKEQKAAAEIEVEQLKLTHETTVSRLNAEIQGRETTVSGLRKEIEDLTSELLIHRE